FVLQLIENPRMHWATVGEYLFNPSVLDGLGMTLLLTVLATAAAYVIGTIVAILQLASNPGLKLIGGLYVWALRSIPQLVLLLIFFNLAAFVPVIELGLPGFGLTLGEIDSRRLISGFAAALIGLSLSEGAYAAEVVRGGIISVDKGQAEAASALGIPQRRIFFRIVLPQAMRAIVPALGNAVIGMLKTTSLVSTIAVHDLLYNVQIIYNANFQVIPLLIVATIWYLVWTTVLSVVQYFVESHYGKGYRGTRTTAKKGFFRKLIDDPASVLSGRR
ncbi:MAG: amino acid ABC transporter permease, partial [Microbacterium sp.]